MAKAEGRGWKSWLPSPKTVVKILIGIIIIKVINSVGVGDKIATASPQIGKYWPVF
jgi:hypothetical protein